MPYPYIRKAQPEDYNEIWSIWMQDHVIQWMSFPPQSKEEFKTHYARMASSSDIYVLVDKINAEEKIVAVRRIKFGKNQYKHIAEYCSMGVDSAHQGKGYAKLFYQEFEKIACKAGITRIQLTQSGGNLAAFHIADKKFNEEAVFPDWLQRSSNHNNFYLIERYMYCFLDDNLTKISSKLPSLKYEEVIPRLDQVENESLSIKRTNNQFNVYLNETPILIVDFDPDDSVIKHIGFLSVQNLSKQYQAEAGLALRKILLDLLKEGRVKKVELFTEDPFVAELCKNAGFFVRGEKIASFYDKDEGYKNEVGLEYSFFKIVDAQNLITAKITDGKKLENLTEVLIGCTKKIQELIENKICDPLGACYLENLIYQIVRDDLGLNKVVSLADKRWEALIDQIPSELQIDIHRLRNRLQNSMSPFFKQEKLANKEQQVEPQLESSQKLEQ